MGAKGGYVVRLRSGFTRASIDHLDPCQHIPKCGDLVRFKPGHFYAGQVGKITQVNRYGDYVVNVDLETMSATVGANIDYLEQPNEKHDESDGSAPKPQPDGDFYINPEDTAALDKYNPYDVMQDLLDSGSSTIAAIPKDTDASPVSIEDQLRQKYNDGAIKDANQLRVEAEKLGHTISALKATKLIQKFVKERL